jgi:hypothetical protein
MLYELAMENIVIIASEHSRIIQALCNDCISGKFCMDLI